VGSESHLDSLKRALESVNVPILGALMRDEALRWRDRHLGLIPVVEHPDEVRRSLSELADAISRCLDLRAIEAVAGSAPLRHPVPLPVAAVQGRVRIAVASGPAFSFMYPDNLERLEQAGAEIVEFDPISDEAIPEHVGGLVAGGGFPETFAEALAANRPLLEDVRHKVSDGLTTWAECGGFLWLANSLDGHRLCGVVDAEGSMTTRLTLGYRLARPRNDNPVVAAGEPVRGHEFHYSTINPEGDGLELAGREGRSRRGYCTSRLLASYLHLHLGADTAPAERFVGLAARASEGLTSN
jgi:cobyrinic acid a,c-diamide synthase